MSYVQEFLWGPDGMRGMLPNETASGFVRAADYAALRQRCEQAEADARRYRFIRQHGNEVTFYGGRNVTSLLWFSPLDNPFYSELMDAAIDAALAHDAQQEGK